MPRYVGLDLHKKSMTYVILDQQGQKVSAGQVAVNRESLRFFGEKILQATDQVAVEATTNTWAVVELLEPFAAKILVSNPMLTKAIASAKVKTDKIDAKVLANLLRCNFLPAVWQPDTMTRKLRSMTARKAAVTHDQTAVKNRIQSMLATQLLIPPVKNLWTREGLEWLEKVEMDPWARVAIDSDLRLLAGLHKEITIVEGELAKVAYQQESMKLLLTLPRVGPGVAYAILAAWGDPKRFPEADKAVSALGLAPSTRQSGDRCYHGPITKMGNSNARWLLVEAAQGLEEDLGPLGASFRKMLKRGKPRNVVVVAHARRLALIAWHILINREPYRYASPPTVASKLSRLRVAGSGEKRKTGSPKGTPRASNYGTGNNTYKVPSLAEVYEKEGLPPAKTLSELGRGEVHMLEKSGTKDFVEQLAHESRRPRKKASQATAT